MYGALKCHDPKGAFARATQTPSLSVSQDEGPEDQAFEREEEEPVTSVARPSRTFSSLPCPRARRAALLPQ